METLSGGIETWEGSIVGGTGQNKIQSPHCLGGFGRFQGKGRKKLRKGGVSSDEGSWYKEKKQKRVTPEKAHEMK